MENIGPQDQDNQRIGSATRIHDYTNDGNDPNPNTDSTVQ